MASGKNVKAKPPNPAPKTSKPSAQTRNTKSQPDKFRTLAKYGICSTNRKQSASPEALNPQTAPLTNTQVSITPNPKP